jgi:hypothetical protein
MGFNKTEYLKQYNKTRYQNPEYREALRESNRRVRQKTREWLRDYKSRLSCIKCGESHPGCLDFHHKDPTQKDRAISQRSSWSIKKLKAEIEKCEVLCANCHRKEHYIVGE